VDRQTYLISSGVFSYGCYYHRKTIHIVYENIILAGDISLRRNRALMHNIHLKCSEGEVVSSGEACYLYLGGTWFVSSAFNAFVMYVIGLFVKLAMN
jgi:hypothetical protein